MFIGVLLIMHQRSQWADIVPVCLATRTLLGLSLTVLRHRQLFEISDRCQSLGTLGFEDYLTHRESSRSISLLFSLRFSSCFCVFFHTVVLSRSHAFRIFRGPVQTKPSGLAFFCVAVRTSSSGQATAQAPAYAATGPSLDFKFRQTAREPKRAHLRVPAFKNTKNPREDPQEREERMKIVAGEGKKCAKFSNSPAEGRVRRRAGGPGRVSPGLKDCPLTTVEIFALFLHPLLSQAALTTATAPHRGRSWGEDDDHNHPQL